MRRSADEEAVAVVSGDVFRTELAQKALVRRVEKLQPLLAPGNDKAARRRVSWLCYDVIVEEELGRRIGNAEPEPNDRDPALVVGRCQEVVWPGSAPTRPHPIG